MASSSRALNAILPQIPKSPYEAHQKARTFASRYVKSGQYDTAIDVLFQSARDLFKNNQPGSGVDLAGFMLDVYDTKGESVTAESRGTLLFRWMLSVLVLTYGWSGRLTQLIALTGSEGGWRKTLIDKSIAYVLLFSQPQQSKTEDCIRTVGPPNSANTLQETLTSSTMLVNSCSRVSSA
jgi:hypothetical protein